MTSNIREEIEKANSKAVERMMESDPVWVGIGPAKKVIPGFKDMMLTHAGPPIDWKRMSGPVRGAVIGAAIYEGWASSPEKADRLAESGEIQFKPNHEVNAVGPMAGIISPNMPATVIHDRKHGHDAFSNLNEGIGKVLRYGAYSEDVIKRLNWMRDSLAASLEAAMTEIRKEKDGVALKPIISQALHMGDECHNRHNAGTSLFLREITPYMFRSGLDKDTLIESYSFMNNNNFTFLGFAMAAAKAMTFAAHNIKYSTLTTVMTRNATDAGIWVSGLGNQWFTAPAPVPKGVWFPGFTEKDAAGDLGDSSITETAGFGGFAMAAAPAIVSWVGGSVDFAVENTRKTYEITQAKHKYFTMPYLNFEGTPTGIDIRKVVKTGITPTINTGIAHKEAGIGQVGAGIVNFPMEMFKAALKAYAEKYGI